MTYQEVVESLNNKKGRQKHLLIGNGFSIAYNPSIFSYNALSNFVEHTDNELLKKLFTVVNTSNFESIMSQLETTKKIAEVLKGSKSFIENIENASQELKSALIEAVKELHPEHVFTIPDDESKNCASFLREYIDKGGSIFSTNYDILLYWVLMRNEMANTDGFGKDAIDQGHYVPEDEIEWTELQWGNNREKQNIFYLHGALHLFDDGGEIIKEKYDGDYILRNIERRMSNGQYPIFVTAGDGNQKLNHILHNHYLADCYDHLCRIGGSLVIVGFNFGEYDDHIIRAINKASKQDPDKKLWSVYIGCYSDSDVKHIESIKSKIKCQKIHTFDSKTIGIWR
jgi:hypothetical protein